MNVALHINFLPFNMLQSSSHILLVRPANFGFNVETAVSNTFQNNTSLTNEELRKKVNEEFENFASVLTSKGINVHVFNDTTEPLKPDAIFPNNWVSFHRDGTVILYPMCTPNRRLEKRKDIIDELGKSLLVKNIIDLSSLEERNKFLEGTGSIVFDHENRIAYACISPRTDKELFMEVCKNMNYEGVCFTSTDSSGKEIYHTNVMMCIAKGFALICLESIKNNSEKENIISRLKLTSHEIINLSFEQITDFSGNMLSVHNNNGTTFLVCSQRAYTALKPGQIKIMEKYCEFLPVPIPTIETIGGGSARCMMAEVFLPALVQA